MLIKFCNGYLDPARVEAIVPSTNRKGYVALTRGGNTVYFEVSEQELKAAIKAAGMCSERRKEAGQ